MSVPTAQPETEQEHRRSGFGRLLGFLLVAVNLRIAVVALSPLLTRIEHTEHLSDSVAGMLTTLPLACFGVFAFTTPVLVRRLGPHRAVASAMLVLVAGIALWLAPSAAALFGGALVVGAGIGIANVVMPGMIKRDFTDRAPLVTGLYTTMLFVSGALAAGLTVPLDDATGIGWHHTLTLWGVPATVALATSAWRARRPERPGRGTSSADDGPQLQQLLRDRVAWAVTVFMGLQALAFYAVTAWLPTLLQSHHMSAGRAGWMLSFATFAGMAGALATPGLNRRLGNGATPVVVAIALFFLGYLGLLTDPVPLIYLWSACLGLASGMCISLAIHYIVARSPDHHHAGHLSAMALGFGYLLACTGPVALGALHNLTRTWTVPILALMAVLGVQLAAGIKASQDRHILATGRDPTS